MYISGLKKADIYDREFIDKNVDQHQVSHVQSKKNGNCTTILYGYRIAAATTTNFDAIFRSDHKEFNEKH